MKSFIEFLLRLPLTIQVVIFIVGGWMNYQIITNLL